MAVGIVTDSTSDIEPRLAARLGITVVPLFVIWGDRSYRDYVDLSRREFYVKLSSEPELPKTSQPSPHMFEEAFAPFAAAGQEIVCITISSKLSGTINAARAAAGSFPGTNISIFDSQSVAGGLGMQARVANDLAKSGAGTGTILEALEKERRAQRLYACIPDLSHVVRTGRIGKARAALGTLMKIVPVISLHDGEVVAEAQVRTFARAEETMIDLALRNVREISESRFLVMHTNAPALAETVRERLEQRFDGVKPKMLEVLEAGPVIATHGGPGAVGVFSAQ
jgi:DegV family protein with EDD domain